MAARYKTKDQAKLAFIESINRSQERQMMPRPTIFRDKTKYNRAARKQRLCREYLI